MIKIHPTAVVHESANIGENVIIHSHVNIAGYTKIG